MMRIRKCTHRFQRAAGSVQGSRQAFPCITSELRTDNVGCADLRPITRMRVLTETVRTRVVPQR